ncbi:MAG TPA: hypothetical protein DEF69_05825 [Barnesiella sp.]|nr:hypothetical protein [Barnesiella sp.]HBX17622.1 hypothetical protein [Barnesiella sp.]
MFETKNVSLCKNTEGFRKVFKSGTISLIFITFAIRMKIEAVQHEKKHIRLTRPLSHHALFL